MPTFAIACHAYLRHFHILERSIFAEEGAVIIPNAAQSVTLGSVWNVSVCMCMMCDMNNHLLVQIILLVPEKKKMETKSMRSPFCVRVVWAELGSLMNCIQMVLLPALCLNTTPHCEP